MSNSITFFWENNPVHDSYSVHTSNEKFDHSDLSGTDELVVPSDQNSVTINGSYGDTLYAMLEVKDTDGNSTFSQLQKVSMIEGMAGSLSRNVYIINSNLDKVVNFTTTEEGSIHDMDVHNGMVYVSTMYGSPNRSVTVYAISSTETDDDPTIWKKDIQDVAPSSNNPISTVQVYNDAIYLSAGAAIYALDTDGKNHSMKIHLDNQVGDEFGTNNRIMSMDIGKSGKLYVMAQRDQADAIYVFEPLDSGPLVLDEIIKLDPVNHPSPLYMTVADSEDYIYFTLGIREWVDGFRDTYALNKYNMSDKSFSGLGSKNASVNGNGFHIKGKHRYLMQVLISDAPSTSIRHFQVLELDSDSGQIKVNNVPDIRVPDLDVTDVIINHSDDNVRVKFGPAPENPEDPDDRVVVEVPNPMTGIEMSNAIHRDGMLVIHYNGKIRGRTVRPIRIPLVEYIPDDMSYSLKNAITAPLDLTIRGDGSIILSNENINSVAPYSFENNEFDIDYSERNNTPLMNRLRPLLGKYSLKFKF